MINKRCKILTIAIIGIMLTTLSVNIYAREIGFKEVSTEKFGKDKIHTYAYRGSGIKVVWIENNDVNKAFTLGVKTPTTDSSGVNHIIEHTLFTGSDKYKSASVFFDASEAYPATYMNALTSSDMTMFPFSTPYDSCYKELLSIYLDAVLKPDFLNQPYGFYEESFYKSPSEDRTGGVVYNEMKGACTGKDRIIFRAIRKMVLKGTGYEYDSGGDPNEIPGLTYEEFIKTYNKYYYPDNMCIIMYGDIDIKESLEEIGVYLYDYCNTKNTKKSEKQNYTNNVSMVEVEGKKNTQSNTSKDADDTSIKLCDIKLSDKYKDRFAVLPKDSKGCIVKSFVFENQLTPNEELKLDLWMKSYIMNSRVGLQKKLISEGFKNIRWMKDNEIPCAIYSMIISDIDEADMDKANIKIQSIIDNMHEYIQGDSFIEQDVIEETKWENSHIDMDINRGIELGQSILDGWAHNKSMTQYYEKSKALNNTKQISWDGYHILNSYNNIYTLFLIEGDSEIISPELLTNIENAQWDKYVTEMKKWQNTSIDMKDVCIDDLVIKPKLKTDIYTERMYTKLITQIKGEFARSNLYIDTSHIKQIELPYLYLYSYLLEECAKEITPFSGIISTKCTAYKDTEARTIDQYTPYFRISILTRSSEIDHDVLLSQVRSSLQVKSDEWYKNKLLNLISEIKDSSKNNVIGTLSEISLGSEKGIKRYLYEQGYPLYQFCSNCLNDNNGEWCFIVRHLDDKIYRRNGIILALAIPKDKQNKYEDKWEQYIEELPLTTSKKQIYKFKDYPKYSVINTNDMVDEVYVGIEKENMIDGIDYVASTYLSKHYLTPNIRVGLGAYGAGCGISYPNTVAIYTYRDPNAEKSLGVIEGAFTFLQKEMPSNILKKTKIEALNKFQIQFGLIGTDLELASANENLILLGQPQGVLEKIQEEIVNSTTKSIVTKGKIYENLSYNKRCSVMTRKNYIINQKIKNYKY